MKRYLLALLTFTFLSSGLLQVESSALGMTPLTEDVIFIGCTVPSARTTGMTVYSLEAVAGNGKWISTELGKAKADANEIIGNHCSEALNKVIGTRKGCPDGKTWQPVMKPTFNALSKGGYGLNLFTLMCSTDYGFCRMSHATPNAC